MRIDPLAASPLEVTKSHTYKPVAAADLGTQTVTEDGDTITITAPAVTGERRERRTDGSRADRRKRR